MSIFSIIFFMNILKSMLYFRDIFFIMYILVLIRNVDSLYINGINIKVINMISDNTIMISSHIASDLESLCDDIYMIDDGKIILHEDTDVLLSNYAILKVDDQTYESIDKNYIYKVKKEDYGYALLTNQKQFYYENYPKIVIQNCSIDDVIYMMIKGK